MDLWKLTYVPRPFTRSVTRVVKTIDLPVSTLVTRTLPPSCSPRSFAEFGRDVQRILGGHPNGGGVLAGVEGVDGELRALRIVGEAGPPRVQDGAFGDGDVACRRGEEFEATRPLEDVPEGHVARVVVVEQVASSTHAAVDDVPSFQEVFPSDGAAVVVLGAAVQDAAAAGAILHVVLDAAPQVGSRYFAVDAREPTADLRGLVAVREVARHEVRREVRVHHADHGVFATRRVISAITSYTMVASVRVSGAASLRGVDRDIRHSPF